MLVSHPAFRVFSFCTAIQFMILVYVQPLVSVQPYQDPLGNFNARVPQQQSQVLRHQNLK